MKSVDRILKGFTKTVNQLQRTAVLAREESANFEEEAAIAKGRAAVMAKESARAEAIAKKLESLLEA